MTQFSGLCLIRTPLRTTCANVQGTSSFSEGVPLPKGWVEYLHPEGNVYYHQPTAGIVSDTDPRKIGVSAALNNAFESIRSRLPQDAKPDDFEVYLNIPDAPRLISDGVVEYYLVDYNSRSIFWVENVNILTDLVGNGSSVEPFESMRHLRMLKSFAGSSLSDVSFYPYKVWAWNRNSGHMPNFIPVTKQHMILRPKGS